MGRVSHYLLRHFASLFASLFFTLFFITSIIFFIKIASITAIIRISFAELGLLYVYLIPNILIYTSPVAFFVALCVSLFNLSKENETIVLFTLGYKPQQISRLFIATASILSLVLVVNVLVLIPIAKQLNTNFLQYKKVEAKFNIKPTEFGQKFDNWLVYINEGEEEDSYGAIVMYQKSAKNSNQRVIIAQSAQIESLDNFLRLKLQEGKAFEKSQDSIEQIDFEKMYISTKPKREVSDVVGIVSYWKKAFEHEKRAFDLSFLLLIALFPVATVLFALSIGIVTYRYEKRGVYLYTAATIFIYVAFGVVLIGYVGLYGTLAIFLATLICSYLYYRKKILLRY